MAMGKRNGARRKRRCGWRRRTCRAVRRTRSTAPESDARRRTISMGSSRDCCQRFYAGRWAGPGCRRAATFRLLLIGYFEGLDCGARDCVARGRFVGAARVSRVGVAGSAAGSFDDLPHASPDRSGDARGGLHLDAAAAGRRGPGQGQDDRHRCDDARGQRGAAQHRAARHGRELSGVPDEAGAGLGHRDADARAIWRGSIGSGRRRARTTIGPIRTIPTRRSRR